MDLDPRICSQARLSRDARFDGRFFIGVRSTRIYCRPICPVRTAREENVRYFPTAAAEPDATEPNAFIYFAYIGAVVLAVGLVLLGVGLVRKTKGM